MLLVVNPVRGPLASPFFFTGARNELQSPPSIDRDGGPRTRSKDNSVQNRLCRLGDNRFQGWSCCGCGRQCNDRGQSGSFDHGTHGTRPSWGLHQVVVLGPTQRSLLCDFCFFGVTAKIFRRNLTWRSNTAGTTSWCAGRRRWCVFSLGRGASKRNITRAPQPRPVDSNVELCSITPSTCLGRPQSLGRRRANRYRGSSQACEVATASQLHLSVVARACGGRSSFKAF